MSTELKALIIGTGVGLRTHYPSLKQNISPQRIGLLSRDVNRAKRITNNELGFYSDNIKNAIHNWSPSLVFVGVPPTEHLSISTKIQNQNSLIVFEKPVGQTFSECKKISRLLSNDDVVINFQLRGLPIMSKIKTLIAKKIGKTILLNIHERSSAFKTSKNSWYFNELKGGGQKLSMLTHLIDLSLFLLGNHNFKDLTVLKSTISKEHQKHTCIISYNSKSTSINIDTSACSYGTRLFQLEVIGTKGTITFCFENGEGNCILYLDNDYKEILWEYSSKELSLFKVAMNEYLKIIVSSKFNRRKKKSNVLASLGDALKVHNILEKIFK